MQVMEEFVQATARQLREDESSTRAATAGLLEALRQQAGEEEFARFVAALPGAAALLDSEGAKTLEDHQHGLAGALGWMRGWAGGTDRDVAFLAALKDAGFSEELVGQFVRIFQRFAEEHAGREMTQKVFSQAPDFKIIAQKGYD